MHTCFQAKLLHTLRKCCCHDVNNPLKKNLILVTRQNGGIDLNHNKNGGWFRECVFEFV
jgi:hypothetical protein